MLTLPQTLVVDGVLCTRSVSNVTNNMTVSDPQVPEKKEITWAELVKRFRSKEPKGASLEARARRVLWHKALDHSTDRSPQEPLYDDVEERWELINE